MRRFPAVLALLVTTWPHVVGMQCDALHIRFSGHGETSVVIHGGHGAPGCTAPMACGSSMIEGLAAERVAEPAPPPPVGGERRVRAPNVAVLTSDPPPPRHHA